MILLALDTSSDVGSVALGEGGVVRARRLLRDRRAHASALIPAVRDVLKEVGWGRRDLDGVVVGEGPGSFTGVRVAAATAKGLVRALGVPLYVESSLASAAVADRLQIPELGGGSRDLGSSSGGGAPRSRPRYVLFDARGERVYGACYRVGDGPLETLIEPHPGRVTDALVSGAPPDTVFCGDGAVRHRARIEEAGFRVLPAPSGVPTADGLLYLWDLSPRAEAVEEPGRWEPRYLRPWRPGWERETA